MPAPDRPTDAAEQLPLPPADPRPRRLVLRQELAADRDDTADWKLELDVETARLAGAPERVIGTHVAHLRQLHRRGITAQPSYQYPPLAVTEALLAEVAVIRAAGLPPGEADRRAAALEALHAEGIYRPAPDERLRAVARGLIEHSGLPASLAEDLLAWLDSYRPERGHRPSLRHAEPDVQTLLLNHGLLTAIGDEWDRVGTRFRAWLGGLYGEGQYRPCDRCYESSVRGLIGVQLRRAVNEEIPPGHANAELKGLLRRCLEDDWV